jgi:hypothetical protein
MNNTLKLEALGLLLLSLFLFNLLPFSWWWYLGLFFAPDISMLGYTAGNKVGAFCYNLFHHILLAVAVYLLGFYMQLDWLQAAGAILLGHLAFDRILGYGLKYITGFKFTHLGKIGKD